MTLSKICKLLIVLVITTAMVLTLYTTRREIDKTSILQTEIKSMVTKIENVSKNISTYQKNIATLQKEILQLQEKVEQYEQDIVFWNKQVENMFGEHNARYFRERRDK
ncbi:MAG: hypothetical protein GX248_09765 [Peptococcaceae bacterium]|jgi:peptidoglycan hydrolase CwlO-like protein|nr:hypothetical protein [Peptococcaceae bacterium]